MPSNLVKKYVCGFAFSKDLKIAYLVRKERPSWQANLLNGVGGLIDNGEDVVQGMCREFFEECGINTYLEQWTTFDSFKNKEIEITYLYCVLDEDQKPQTTTDEQVWSVYWQNYNYLEWERLGVIADVPHLIYKAHCQLTQSQASRAELQYKAESR